MDPSTANQITTPGNQNFFLLPSVPLAAPVRGPPCLPRRGGALRRRRPPLRLFPRRLPRPVLSVPPRSSKTRFLLPPTTTRTSVLARPRPRSRSGRSHAQTQSLGL